MTTEVTPFDQIELTTMLADFGKVTPDGLLSVIGAGIQQIGGPMAMAVCGFAHVPYRMANTQFTINVELWDLDGAPVLPFGATEPVRAEAMASVAPNAQARRGQTLILPFAIPFVPLPIPAGSYEWRITVDGRGETRWNRLFTALSGVDVAT